MAIPFLQHLDLKSSAELRNALLHKTTSGAAVDAEAGIIYDTGSSTVKYYNGSAWISLTSNTNDYVSGASLSGTDLVLARTGSLSDLTIDLSSLDELVNDSTITITAGTYLSSGGLFTTNQASDGTITLNHDDTTRTDSTHAETLTYGGTFTAYTDVTTNATGHVTDSEETTFTMPALVTYGLEIGQDGNNGATIELIPSSGTTQVVTIDGVPNQTKVTEDVGFDGTIYVGLADDVTFTNDIHIVDAGKAFFGTDDDLSIFHDGTDGSIDNATGNLEIKTTPSNSDFRLTSGGSFTFKVDTSRNAIQAFKNGGVALSYNGAQRFETTASGATVHGIANITGAASIDGTLDMNSNKISNVSDPTNPQDAATKAYADSLIVGGLIYQGSYDAATNTPDLTTSPNSILQGWTYTVTVEGTFFGEQLRVGDVIISEENDPSALADWTTVQNNVDLADLTTVGIGNVNAGTGIDVSYASGTATVSLTPTAATSFAGTISTSDTVTHNLGTKDVIVQLYDISTESTVYAGVDRQDDNSIYVTFVNTPANSIRVLVQKIG